MAKPKLKNRASYFIVTTDGRLKKLSPLLILLTGCILLGLVILISNRCYAFNRRLVDERVSIQTQLLQINSDQNKLVSELKVCDDKKQQICRLLYFNTDSSEKTTDPGKSDEK